MDVGMLWFDADRDCDVSARITRASDFYKSKYGRKPNLCFLHPTTAGEAHPGEVDGLQVRTSKMVLPDHFWLGVEKAKQSQAGRKRAA
ncbi:MAG: hypothetical protein V3V44_01365 [Anaerolineales bacterium]|jgi:hypothetical protein